MINPALLRTPLSRAELLAIQPGADAASIAVAVHRNHSFELVASVLNAFLGASRLCAQIQYSSYDDSLNFAPPEQQPDLHIIWLDASRYAPAIFDAWLTERIETLSAQTRAPILAVCARQDAGLPETTTHGATLCHLDAELGLPSANTYSERLAALTGTRLSPEALLESARLLGLRYIPALMQPALKAIVTDLDNTLCSGVLGEDGPHGVQPRYKLQEHLKNLAGQGFLLALSSKNEERDVRDFFEKRTDLPLRWEDFSAHEVHWGSKAESITRIAGQFNIGEEAILFLDDNPGELLCVEQALPAVTTLAATGEEETLKALSWQPGLFRLRNTPENALRRADILANRDRLKLKSLSPEAYLNELAIELDFHVNPHEQQGRITELLGKTNQFLLAFLRPPEALVNDYLSGRGRCIITARLQDRLSDSGVIAVAMFERENASVTVRELAVSCRALGRGIEKAMLAKMLTLGQEKLEVRGPIFVAYKRGPRNGPGLAWLEELYGQAPGESGLARIPDIPVPDLTFATVRIHPEKTTNTTTA